MVYGRRPLGFAAPYSTSTSAFPVSVPPSPAQRTAVTFGWSIQESRMSGPTEFMTTIVLLFCAATAWTSASPLFHAVKLFLCGATLGFSSEVERWKSGHVPITLVAVHGNVVLARVGQQEDDCSILLYGSGACADEIEVVEKPREGSVIVACTSLECFVWLSTVPDQYHPIA